jgi:outer membrane protein
MVILPIEKKISKVQSTPLIMIKMANRLLAVLAVMLVMAIPLQAQELKIGYLNPQDVLERMPETATIEKELNDLAQSRQTSFTTRVQKFQTDVQRFQQNAAVMSNDAREKEEQRLIGEEEALQGLQVEIQQELATKRNDLLRPVLEKIDNAISEVAKELNLTYVLNESTSQGESILLFISDDGKNRLNITEKVVAKLVQ